MNSKQIFGLLLFLSMAIAANSQNELGIPMMDVFTPKEYKGAPQNLALVDDNRGFIIIGNTDGVIEFDGANWRVYSIQYTPRVSSKAKDGRIYFNTDGELSYLSHKNNNLYVKSLAPLYDSTYAVHGTATENLEFDNKFYFLSTKNLFRYLPEEEKMDVFDAPNKGSMSTIFNIKDKLFVSESGHGLFEFKNDFFLRLGSNLSVFNIGILNLELIESISALILKPHV